MKLKILITFFFSLISILSVKAYAEVDGLRYVAIGDSYTIGTGVSAMQSWPSLLADHLRSQGIKIYLVANPSQGGWTTFHALRHQLPVYQKAKPDFATLMIGANDWVGGVTAEAFRASLAKLMDAMLAELPVVPGQNKRLLVINIPDFSATPQGKVFERGRDISHGLGEFNQIIAEEASKRTLTVIDIFPVSQKMRTDPTLISSDGMHPSAKGYLLFEEAIYPAAKTILANK